jgi:class 3 adenylate cyclase
MMPGVVEPPASRPFVGRTRERALVRHLIRDAAEGRAAVVVVSGVAGAGKTALLGWAAREAADAGAFVLRASGSEDALPGAAPRRLAAHLPEVDLGTTGDAEGLGAAMAGALAAQARRRLVAVVVDDVHELEPSSAAALGAVLAGLDDTGARSPLSLLVLLAGREPVAEGSLADRALRLDATRAVTLGGFDRQDVHDLVRLAGERPTPDLVGELLDDTGGLPLLVVSALDGRAHGAPVEAGRVRTIADALRSRLRPLDPAALDVLRLAALLGEPWHPVDVVRSGPYDDATVRAAVEAARDAGVAVPARHGLRFSHPLVRTALLDGLSDDRRRLFHRLIADGLAAGGPGLGLDDQTLVRVADHRLRAGAGADGDLCRRAGEIAGGWAAWREAARFFSAAAEAGQELWFEAGRAAYLAHDPDRAEELLGRAIERTDDAATAVQAAMVLVRCRAGQRFRIGTRVDTRELEAALGAASTTGVAPATVIEAEAAMAEALLVSGESEQALRVVGDARRRSPGPPSGDLERALGRLDFAEGIHRLRRLELAAADRCFRSGAKRSAAEDEPTALLHRSRLALITLMQGSVRAARDQAQEVEERTRAAGRLGEAGFAAAQLAAGYVLAGAAAAGATAEAAEQAHRLWRATGYAYTAALLAPVLAIVGTRAQAVPLVPTEPDLDPPSVVPALAAAEAGDAGEARARLRRARWRGGVQGPVTQNSEGIAVAGVELGDLLDEPQVVASAAGAVETLYERGVLVTLGWPASVLRLAAVVARHRGDARRAQRLAEQAAGWCEHERVGAEAAKVRLELARCEAAAGGSRRDVAALLAEAADAFDAEGMVGWASRAEAVAERLGHAVVRARAARERTIFTSDVVGSTASNVRLGDALYLEQLRIHDRLVRARLREFGGIEIKHTGDGLNAVFHDTTEAARCALAVQDDITAWHRAEPDLALLLRIGLAHGPAIPSGGDWFGLVQSEAARLCALAQPGEVIGTAGVTGRLARAGLAVDELGPQQMKGLPDAIEVFRLRRR